MTTDIDPNSIDDFTLLDAWRTGDEQAGQQLFRRHLDLLYRFFHNKTSRDVDDLVQESCLACLKAQHAFRKSCSFKTYLLALARFQLYDHYRRCARDGACLEFNTITLHDLEPSASAHAAARAEETLLLNALRRLPLNLQIALELTYWEDMKAPEVADVLDIPVDTVYTRLRRARQLLRHELSKVSPAAPREDEAERPWLDWVRSLRRDDS